MNKRFDRQSFLGERAQFLLESASVGIIGLGGGGSHVAQQLAHVGIGKLILFDPDQVEHSNLNRLVGATAQDADTHRRKVDVAARLIESVNPSTTVVRNSVQWQLAASTLREADVIVSCLDTYAARQDLEVSARRFLTPLVDVGMDVHQVDGRPHISGQVIVSSPIGPCFRCFGFLTDASLRQEAQLYGAAGGRPQVIWANGVLASIAVGLVVQILTCWSSRDYPGEYLHYDGNTNCVSRSPRLIYAPTLCAHFRDVGVGEPRL